MYPDASVGNAYLATDPESAAETLTGAVYSDKGGPSGSGTGEIRLKVGSDTYELDYQKPYQQDFATPRCRDIGAIWSVQVTLRGRTSGELQSASCRGAFDIGAHDAWMTVHAYLDDMATGRIESAMGMLSNDWRVSPEFKAIRTAMLNVLWTDYKRFGGRGRCLDVDTGSSVGAMRVTAGVSCLLSLQGHPATIAFVVSGNPKAKRTEITEIAVQPVMQIR